MQEQFDGRVVVALFTKNDPSLIDHFPEVGLQHAPVARLGRTYLSPRGGCNRVHEAIVPFASSEDWAETPWAAGIVVRVLVLACSFISTRQKVANFLPVLAHRRVQQNVVVSWRYRSCVASPIEVFPHHRRNKRLTTEDLVA
ncbi:hypothetical protein FQZ97_1046010 [compost metagenome]